MNGTAGQKWIVLGICGFALIGATLSFTHKSHTAPKAVVVIDHEATEIEELSSPALIRRLQSTVFGDEDYFPDDPYPILREMVERGDPSFALAIKRIIKQCDWLATLNGDKAKALTKQHADLYAEPWAENWTKEQTATFEEIENTSARHERYKNVSALLATQRKLSGEPSPVSVQFAENTSTPGRTKMDLHDSLSGFSAEWPDFPNLALFLQNTDPSRRTYT
ncbi:MAG: hypothetical protein AB8G99_19170 [Planctomycetaceae bacterium]